MNTETVEIKINEHDNILKEHSKEIDNLKQDGREFKTEIKNLCDNIKNLTSTMKWFMGIWVTSLLGFFFYAIQSGLYAVIWLTAVSYKLLVDAFLGILTLAGILSNPNTENKGYLDDK